MTLLTIVKIPKEMAKQTKNTKKLNSLLHSRFSQFNIPRLNFISMDELTDQFFFTKHTYDPTNRNPTVSRSLTRPILSRKQEIQQLYNNYNLFKYSKCFATKRRYSLREVLTERDGSQNYKSVKRESEKLKERLGEMEKDRKVLLEKLRLHPNQPNYRDLPHRGKRPPSEYEDVGISKE